MVLDSGAGSAKDAAMKTSDGLGVVVRRLVRALALCSGVVGLAGGCGGGTSAPMCTATMDAQAAAEFCAPAMIAANQELQLQLREQCGGCTKRAQSCAVTVTGQTVKLKLVGQVCTLPEDVACPAICSVSTFNCKVPALLPGTYRVSAEGSTMPETMMVTDERISATACTVSTP